MNAKDNGGDAFPMSTPSDIYPGMTLLDYFAGQVLAAVLANPDTHGTVQEIGAALAEAAYAMADAMIAERSKATPPSNANAQTGAK